MKRSICLIVPVLFFLTTVTCCNAEPAKGKKGATPMGAESTGEEIIGTVVETMNTGGYTYVQVDTGEEKVWAAAPEFKVKTGDLVTVPRGMLMRNHHSKTLDRTFDEIYFVSGIRVAGAEEPSEKKTASPHGNIAAKAPKDIDFSGIKKPKGGKSVEELYAEKDSLNGKEVTVRGKVVKFSSNIMGKNWMHIQDGTGGKDTNDLTVTTKGVAKVGDTVVIKGKMAADKDLGFGYKYTILVEDASVTVE